MSKATNPIVKSWAANAKKWIKTIENSEIESRRLVTNTVILQSILQQKPASVLDIGCGEGWLVNTLTKHKINAIGIDATKALIKNAKTKGKGMFKVMDYETLIKGVDFEAMPFDLISINFALFENKKTAWLIKKLPHYLSKEGKIIIQTLHPFSIATEEAYKSAWRKDSWKGLKRNFTQPYKWYFRTLADWVKLFTKAGLVLEAIKEPLHPKTGQSASIVFILSQKFRKGERAND